jgi:endonuclease/exonuclease/phosphatase family metal-dependent hydrolase
MLHGRPDFENLSLRLDLMAGEILRLEADVVLLQEAPWTKSTGNAAQYLAQKLGYNYLYYRANGNRRLISFEEGEAILSRYPLEEAHFSILHPKAGFFENRVLLGATVDTTLGDVKVFVTHLTDKDPQVNFEQVESLRDIVEPLVGGSTIVAGDFNARENSPQLIELTSNWVDTYRTIHPGDPGLTCCIDNLTSGSEDLLEKRIDYIFLVEKNEATAKIIDVRPVFHQPFSVEGGWQWASDHTGLMLEMQPIPSNPN